MLPKIVKLDHLDSGVRDLVVNLNRIPNVDTFTNCEGHIWRNTPNWPTKDGWVYFTNPSEEYPSLIKGIDLLIHYMPHFTFESEEDRGRAGFTFNTIRAEYESHDWGNLFERISPEEQEAYFQRAELRHGYHLLVWEELNDLVETWIRKNLSSDIKSLPYRYSQVKERQKHL